MSRPKLHLVTTGKLELEEAAGILARCPSELVDVVHIREKQRTAREIMLWYETFRNVMPHSAIHINDRLDAAAAVGAPGVQLAYHSVPCLDARRLLPAGTVIGCSLHSEGEAVEAEAQGADFVLFGHVYPTGSKPGLAARGSAMLNKVARSTRLPVIAIGGIEPDRVAEVLAAGASGIAVMSSVFGHADPDGQVRRLRRALDERLPHLGGGA